jgi:hypothetical protein
MDPSNNTMFRVSEHTFLGITAENQKFSFVSSLYLGNIHERGMKVLLYMQAKGRLHLQAASLPGSHRPGSWLWLKIGVIATLVTEIIAPAGDRNPEYKYAVIITKITQASMTSETRLRAGQQENRCSIPGRENRLTNLSALQNVHTGSGFHLASYPISTMAISRCKTAKAWTWRFPPSNVDIKNKWSSTCTTNAPSWMHREEFTVIMSEKQRDHQKRCTGWRFPGVGEDILQLCYPKFLCGLIYLLSEFLQLPALCSGGHWWL